MAFFGSRSKQDRAVLLVCPKCGGRVSRGSIRLQAEQYLYEIAQDMLAIQLARHREQEEEENAETDPSP